MQPLATQQPDNIIHIRPTIINRPIERIIERERIIAPPSQIQPVHAPVFHETPSSPPIVQPVRQTDPIIQVVRTPVPVASEPVRETQPVSIAVAQPAPLQGVQENQSIAEKKIKESEPEKSNEIEPKNQRENQISFDKKSKPTLILAKPETAQGADKPKFYKKRGRQRTEALTKEVIVYRLQTGKWPHGLSEYMCWYYNTNYILKGAKNSGKTRQWRAESKAAGQTQSGKINATRPRTNILPIVQRRRLA